MRTLFKFGLLILLCFHSCKKTRLEGEFSILVGKWKWKHTIVTSDDCTSFFPGPYIIYTPAVVGYEYEVTFIEKGKVVLKKGNKDKKYRIINNPNYPLYDSPTDTAFYFYLNKENKKRISVQYHKYSGIEYLYSSNLPMGLIDGYQDCKGHISIFEKVE